MRRICLARNASCRLCATLDVRQQVFRQRQLGQLRRAQRGQLLAQGEHVERLAPLLAPARRQELAGVFVTSAHCFSAS
jgi:hypothetical protein